ncbi:MAG: helix-turn-helix transcriptional regulator [Methanosphaera sp.]|uniref:winged helix-turn-helix transcriptional regulator n=1 Tax=Methanosphaera sp. ISO3-F5 TaxID=1452353 RepID=UPI002B257C5F|nr:helix-turn-helix domain-containing protein [Methanosphaera sp. ISO3-F5]MBR0471912.1 helix-turn-helix transcriptional regulator [Methanosphaera sp.]WQH63371.1 helix-turn-helix domain-containing protein [Methanosphaera sp. ISO3-F5]
MDEYKEIFESWGGPDCPMEATVELIGRKWVIALIRDMYVGKKHFTEFKKNKPALNNSVLSDTLKFMCEKGLVEKIIIDEDKRSNTEYHLTDKAKKLNHVIYAMILYGLDVLDCCDELPEIKHKMKKGYYELFEIGDYKE